MLNKSVCQVCGDNGPDMRHVTVETLYDVSEFVPKAEPTELSLAETCLPATGFTVICCKTCRARFHRMFRAWANQQHKHLFS